MKRSPPQPQIVVNLLLTGRTQTEIAELLNVGRGTVAYRYCRALALLSTGEYV
jgi:DNA-directed RNA polymerase specialized sigma24 family protein